MQALPFLLKGLLQGRGAAINTSLQENGAQRQKIKDPTNSLLFTLCAFLSWYCEMRQPMKTATQIVESAKTTEQFQLLLKKIWPDKSGQHMSCCTIIALQDMCNCTVCELFL